MIDNGYSTLEELKDPGVSASIPKDTMTKTAADLLTPDEVSSLIGGCHPIMDRSLIAMLYEGGFLIGELAQLTWGAISFDSYARRQEDI